MYDNGIKSSPITSVIRNKLKMGSEGRRDSRQLVDGRGSETSKGKGLETRKSIHQTNDSVTRYTFQQPLISQFSSRRCLLFQQRDSAILMTLLAHRARRERERSRANSRGRENKGSRRKETVNVAKERSVIIPAWTQKIAG